MKLYDFAHHPDMCGTRYAAPSWDAHRVIWRLYDGDAHLLTDEQREVAYQLLGCRALPTGPPQELFIGAGRRCGKTQDNALFGVHAASTDFRDRLAPGEWATIPCVCADRKQARTWFDACKGLIEASAVLLAEVTNMTSNTIEFAHRSRLEVHTSSFRSVRGYTMPLAIIDEAAYLRSDESALPDIELYRALTPALMTLHGRLIVTSSLHRKRGLMFQKYRQHYGKVA